MNNQCVACTHTCWKLPCVCLRLPLWLCSIDYPVKWFVVVVGEQVAAGKNAIAYEVKHLLEYPQDKVGEWVWTGAGTECVSVTQCVVPRQGHLCVVCLKA